MNGSSSFSNDVPHNEEPECAVPEDSNNSDHCAQYSEFDTCKLCNSGYELMSDNSCTLTEQEIDEDNTDPVDDDETLSEDIFWQVCTNDDNNHGYLCPADNDSKCHFLDDGSSVECSTWLDIVTQNQISSACSLCPASAIANCATQSGDLCVECASG